MQGVLNNYLHWLFLQHQCTAFRHANTFSTFDKWEYVPISQLLLNVLAVKRFALSLQQRVFSRQVHYFISLKISHIIIYASYICISFLHFVQLTCFTIVVPKRLWINWLISMLFDFRQNNTAQNYTPTVKQDNTWPWKSYLNHICYKYTCFPLLVKRYICLSESDRDMF